MCVLRSPSLACRVRVQPPQTARLQRATTFDERERRINPVCRRGGSCDWMRMKYTQGSIILIMGTPQNGTRNLGNPPGLVASLTLQDLRCFNLSSLTASTLCSLVAKI